MAEAGHAGWVIHVDDRDHVRTLTLDRPEARNAFDQAQYHGLATLLAAAADDADVHVVVVTGTGPSFSAGQDLKEMALLAAGQGPVGGAPGFPALLARLESFGKPLIAAVNGSATGIGATILLHCDIVIVAETARLRMPFAELGVPPEAGSSVLLPAAIGWQRAAELLFTARWVAGPEAVELGMALRCVPLDDLASTAAALAADIARHSPGAVQVSKRLMLAGRADISAQARERENHGFVELGFGGGPT